MSVTSLLEKLDSSLGKTKQKGKIDFAELKELKAKSFIKLHTGKNNLVFITPPGKEDPFVFWGIHQGLQEVSYYSVPCDNANNNESCTVCNVVADLKAENFVQNKTLWYPIKQVIEYYAPVVDLDNLEAGLRWLRVSKSVMTQLTEWIRNLEVEEQPFYSDDEPQKIIITYTKDVAPAEQYKLDKKNFKGFSKEQLEGWRETLKPLTDFMFSKKQDDIVKMVDEYFARVSKEVATPEEDNDEVPTEESVVSKLSAAKTK